jgi:hypothetical protein
MESSILPDPAFHLHNSRGFIEMLQRIAQSDSAADGPFVEKLELLSILSPANRAQPLACGSNPPVVKQFGKLNAPSTSPFP